MAGRQLQRLLKEQLPPADDDEVSSSEEEEEEEPNKPAFNPFDLLTDGDSPEAGSEDDEEEPESEEDEPASLPPPPAQARKAAGSGKAAAAAPKGKTKPQEEDLDAILAELNITPAEPGTSSAGGGGSSDARPLLAVSPAHLRAEEELRRMFGSMGVRGGRDDEDDSQASAYAGASRRVRRLAARGLLRPVGGPLRPGVLVTPRETWPRPDGGVALRSLGGGSYEIQYSMQYEAVQGLYEECQATFDPNAVAALLRSHPYHLDALLTMADLYRATADNAYADEMVERAVYALECGWPPGFMAAAGAGEARVKYSEASAPLFTALARHVGALGRRGLHRTALETCKLLLQLDADDPMGALQQIDYFAVRAGQYEFLRRFVEGAGGGGGDAGSAALLPNMAYSMALARWYHEQEKGKKKKGGSGDAAPEDAEPSEDLLVKAILLHPLVVVRLQGKLAEAGVGKDARWTEALAHPLYAQADDGGCPGLGHLVDIFVERQAALWKAGQVQEWLYGGVRRACAVNVADLPGGLGAGDWAAVRAQAFPPSDANAYGHLRIYDFSDSVPRLPAEEVHGMAHAAQAQALGAADVEAALAAELARLEAAGGGGAEALRDQNPVMALLRSLLPWVAEGQQPEYGADEEDDTRDRREQEGPE